MTLNRQANTASFLCPDQGGIRPACAGIPDERIFVDKKTGATTDHEGLRKMLAYARPGDTILVDGSAATSAMVPTLSTTALGAASRVQNGLPPLGRLEPCAANP